MTLRPGPLPVTAMSLKPRRSGREIQAAGAGARAWARRHAFSLLSSLGNLARHPLASMMTFGVLAFAAALPLVLHVALVNLERIGQQWERLDTLSVFLELGIAPGDVDRLVSRISSWPEVSTVDPISPEQGMAELSNQLGVTEISDLVADNPLPWVLEVTPVSSIDRHALLARLDQESATAAVIVDLQWLERLDAMTELLAQIVALLAVLLALGVAAIIGNTIRLDIQNRREEIEVMSLVGATAAFIRRPFLYTGLWYGLIGGLLACLIVTAGLLALDEPVRNLSQTYTLSLGLQAPGPEVIGLVILGSGLFGLLGSWLVVAQHLRRIDP